MLLTISTSHEPATDLAYLLHKHPDRFQTFDMSFGKAHVFYPQVENQRCTAALLLEVDPVGMVRGKSRDQSFLLGQYVNDRPFVASSFMSTAISQVFGSAMSGKCKDRPEMVTTPITLTAQIDVLPVRGGEGFVHKLFEPLGYTVEATRHPLDERFPEWGEGPYFSVTINGTKTLSDLLTHLYVLIPVFDNSKHYFVGDDEIEKLLAKGEGWLAQHPEKEQITRRYLKNRIGGLISRHGAVKAWSSSHWTSSCGIKGLLQPAIKCRGREYLRIIYGPDYTSEEHLLRLRSRGLGAKRSLALREFALGIEGLERFARHEPLRRVHECVFGVLALESEPVDPRL